MDLDWCEDYENEVDQTSLKLDNSDLVVPNTPNKDFEPNGLGEENIDLGNIAPEDNWADKFSFQDFLADDKAVEHYLTVAGTGNHDQYNLHQLQAVSNDTSLYDQPATTPMLSSVDPTLPSMFAAQLTQPTLASASQLPVEAPAMATSVPTVPESKTRGRKSAHVVMQCSPPTYEDYPESPAIKQEPASVQVTKNSPRRRKASSSASSSHAETEADSPPTNKRIKMHELVGNPNAKNAVAAKRNREKKKNEEARLKTENGALRNALSGKDALIQELMSSVKQQKSELELEKARVKSLQGLARVTKSATDILGYVVSGIYTGSGEKYAVEFPNWFRSAPGNAQDLEQAQQFLEVGKTSSFITLHVSQQEKRILVDYTPSEPRISHDIPQ